MFNVNSLLTISTPQSLSDPSSLTATQVKLPASDSTIFWNNTHYIILNVQKDSLSYNWSWIEWTCTSYAGLYNVTKTLAFASYFCKMRVQILYWSPDGELIFLEHFHSITDHIFHFKIWLWFSDLLNCTIDSDIKVLNHIRLTLTSDNDKQKSKTFIQNFSLKINRLN